MHIAGPLGVTQFLILTATENACYLRIAKAPRVGSHRLLPFKSAFWNRLSDLPVTLQCCLASLHYTIVRGFDFQVSFALSACTSCIKQGHFVAKLMPLVIVAYACTLK